MRGVASSGLGETANHQRARNVTKTRQFFYFRPSIISYRYTRAGETLTETTITSRYRDEAHHANRGSRSLPPALSSRDAFTRVVQARVTHTFISTVSGQVPRSSSHHYCACIVSRVQRASALICRTFSVSSAYFVVAVYSLPLFLL